MLVNYGSGSGVEGFGFDWWYELGKFGVLLLDD